MDYGKIKAFLFNTRPIIEAVALLKDFDENKTDRAYREDYRYCTEAF